MRGFTLLETLVVVAIIAILSGALLLSARGGGSERRLEDEARRVIEVLRLTCDRAEIEARYLGVGFASSSYGGYELTPRGWEPLTQQRHGPLRIHTLPDGVTLWRTQEPLNLEPALPEQPQLLCSPTGEMGDLRLDLLTADGAGWRLRRDDSGVATMLAATP